MDMSKYKALFVSETQEHLQSMNRGLVAIEQDPGDQESIAEVFRNAHSIKGMAASMGFEPVRDLSHAMEDLMEGFRDGTRQVESDAMDLLFKGLDLLEGMLEEISQEKEVTANWEDLYRQIRDKIGQAKAGDGEIEAAPAEDLIPEEMPGTQEQTEAVDEDESMLDDFLEDTGSFEEDEEEVVVEEVEDEDEEDLAAGGGEQDRAEKPKGVQIEVDFDDPGPRRRLGAGKRTPHNVAPPPAPEAPEGEETGLAAPEKETPQPDLSQEEEEAHAPGAEELYEERALWKLRVVFSNQAAAPGVRGLILFKRLGELGNVVTSKPSLDEVKAGNFLSDDRGLAVDIDLETDSDEGEIKKALDSVADIEAYDVEAPAAEEKGPGAEEQSLAEPVVQDFGKVEPSYDPFAQAQALPQTVRVKTSALDNFINTLGEMILVKSELWEVAKKSPLSGLEEGLDRLESLVKDFHDQVMTIRMMPLESVVQRLPRVVRDLARDEGKKVKFEVRGQDIELDRAILEQLGDPLIHLLRNSVNHGLETPEERQRTGKSPEGHIVLEAYRRRDLVLIDVRDDGRGIEPMTIREAAVSKGLLTPEQADHMGDDDVVQLIFEPGFSTAIKVGMVSGRGVGMDAVKNTVENLGGFVTTSTQAGRGTTFTLHLPRTIAIVNVLLVRLQSEVFAIPISKIMKTVEILPHQIRTTQGKKFYLDRQEMVPMKRLHRFLDITEPEENGRREIPALIVETHNRKVALVVDELVGQEEAFIRPLGKPLERISGLSGVTMLGDGRAVFVLDTMSLL